MNTFSLRVYAADKPFFEGECVSLVIPTASGQYGILAHHSNFVAAVVPGEMDLTIEKDGRTERVRAAVSDGIAKTENNTVLVLVDTAERAEDIDETLAKRDADAALEDLSHKQSRMEFYAAQARLARAMNRLRVVRHK